MTSWKIHEEIHRLERERGTNFSSFDSREKPTGKYIVPATWWGANVQSVGTPNRMGRSSRLEGGHGGGDVERPKRWDGSSSLEDGHAGGGRPKGPASKHSRKAASRDFSLASLPSPPGVFSSLPFGYRDAFASKRWCIDRPSPVVVVVVVLMCIARFLSGKNEERASSHECARSFAEEYISRPTTEEDDDDGSSTVLMWD